MATWQELARESLKVAQKAPTDKVASSDLTSLIKDPEMAKSILKMADASAYRDLEGKDKKLNLLQRLGEVFSVDEWTDDMVRALQSWYNPQTGEVTPLKGIVRTVGMPADYVASGVRKLVGGVVGDKELSNYDAPHGKDVIPQLIATGQAVFDPGRFQAKSAQKGSALTYEDVEKNMSGVAKAASGTLGMVLDTVATPSFWLSGSTAAVGKLSAKGTKTVGKGLKEASVATMEELAEKNAADLATKALKASGLEVNPENIAGVMKSSSFLSKKLKETLPKGLYKVGPLTKGATPLKTGAVADTVARYIDNPMFAALGDVFSKTKGIKVNDTETLGSTLDTMVNGVKEKMSEGYAIKKYGGDVTKYHLDALANELKAADYTSKVRQASIANHLSKIRESGNTDAINQAKNWITTREYMTGASEAGELSVALNMAFKGDPKGRVKFEKALERSQGAPWAKKIYKETKKANIPEEYVKAVSGDTEAMDTEWAVKMADKAASESVEQVAEVSPAVKNVPEASKVFVKTKDGFRLTPTGKKLFKNALDKTLQKENPEVVEFFLKDDVGYQVQKEALAEYANQVTQAGQEAQEALPKLNALNRNIDTKFKTLDSLTARYSELKSAISKEGRDPRYVAMDKKEMRGIRKQMTELSTKLDELTKERTESYRTISRYKQLVEQLEERDAKLTKYAEGRIKQRQEKLLRLGAKDYTPKLYPEDKALLSSRISKYKPEEADAIKDLEKAGFSHEMAVKTVTEPTGFEKYLNEEFANGFEPAYYKQYAAMQRKTARWIKAREMALRGDAGEITYDITKEGDVIKKTPNNLEKLTADAMFKVSDEEVEELAQQMFAKDFPGAKISEVESGALDPVGDLKKEVDSTFPGKEKEKLLFREQNFASLMDELGERYGYLDASGKDDETIASILKDNIEELSKQLSKGKVGNPRISIFIDKAKKELKAQGYKAEKGIEDPVVAERVMDLIAETKHVEDSLDAEILEKLVHEQNLLEAHRLTSEYGYRRAAFYYGGQEPLEGPLLRKTASDKDIYKTPEVQGIDRDIEWSTENDVLKKTGGRPSGKISSEFEEIPLLKADVPTPWEQYLEMAKSRYLREWEKNNVKAVRNDIISGALDSTKIKDPDEKIKFVNEAEDVISTAVRGSVEETGGIVTPAEEKLGMFLVKAEPEITKNTRIMEISDAKFAEILDRMGAAVPGKERVLNFIRGYKQEVARQEAAFNETIAPWIEKTLLPDEEKQDILRRIESLKASSLGDMSVPENRKKVLEDVLALERRFQKIAQTGDARDQMAAKTMLEVFLRPMKEHADQYLLREQTVINGKKLGNIGYLGVGHRSLDVPATEGLGVGNVITQAKRKYATQAVLEGYNAMGIADPIKMKTDVESIVKDVVGHQAKEEAELVAFHKNMVNLLEDIKAGKAGEGIKILKEGETLNPDTWVELTGIPGLEGQNVYVMKELKGEFDRLVKFWKKDNVKGVMKYVKFFNNIWKGIQTGAGVNIPKISGKLYEEAEKLGLKNFADFFNEQAAFLPLSPSFTARNVLTGNLPATLLAGGMDIKELPTALNEAAEIQRALLRAEGATEFNQGIAGILKANLSQEELAKAVEEIQKSGILTETQVGNELLKAGEAPSKFFGKATEAITEGRSMKFNNNMELLWKIAVFRNARKAGRSVEDAVGLVNKALFDYSALTPFEQEYIRPYTVFYTWTKKNVELMADLMTNEPQKFKFYAKLLTEPTSQFSNVSEEERERLPNWTESLIGIPYTTGGETRYLSGYGGNLEAFMEVMGAGGETFTEQAKGGARKAVDMLAPAFKIPFNLLVTGQNTFKGIPIEEDTSAYGYRALPGFMKKALGITEKQWVSKEGKTGTTYIMDGEKKYLIESTLGRASSVPLKALSIASGEDKPTAGLLDMALGIKTNKYDTNYLKYNEEKEQREALMKELERLGLVTQYTGYGYNSAGAKLNQPLVDEYLRGLVQQL